MNVLVNHPALLYKSTLHGRGILGAAFKCGFPDEILIFILMKKTTGAIVQGLIWAVIAFVVLLLFFNFGQALNIAILIGIVLTFFSVFTGNKSNLDELTKIDGIENMNLLYEDPANYVSDTESVAGKLYLFDDNLHFKAANKKVATQEKILPLVQVEKVDFFDYKKFVHNGLILTMKDGTEEQFLVSNRTRWKEKIELSIINQDDS